MQFKGSQLDITCSFQSFELFEISRWNETSRMHMNVISQQKTVTEWNIPVQPANNLSVFVKINVIHFFLWFEISIWALNFAIFPQSRKTLNQRHTKLSTNKVVLLLWPTLIKRSRNGLTRVKNSGNVHPNELYIITWFLITVEPLPRPRVFNGHLF